MNRTDDWADYLDPEVTDPELTPAERAALDRIAGALADESTWGEPPAHLRTSLLDRVTQEAAGRTRDGTPPATSSATSSGVSPELSSVASPGTPRTVSSARARRAASLRARRTWWLSVAGAAAAAALVAVVAWPHPQTTTFAMAGTSLAPRASATAELEPRSAGVAIRLEIKGLAPAPPGAYYAAWLRGPAGVVPVGTFHWHKGGIPIDLWSGVGSDAYPQLFVTLQREGRPPDPSAQVVLTGRVGG
ncbi:MAG TPA: anti-sigma factor [Kineosporiaceae bacterium]|jgi:hypothetical protein|nr:anti-sigma factor [Kineosporiaceae bacterium]